MYVLTEAIDSGGIANPVKYLHGILKNLKKNSFTESDKTVDKRNRQQAEERAKADKDAKAAVEAQKRAEYEKMAATKNAILLSILGGLTPEDLQKEQREFIANLPPRSFERIKITQDGIDSKFGKLKFNNHLIEKFEKFGEGEDGQ